MADILNIISLWILPVILITVLTTALIKKVPVYEQFTKGAKDGFKISVKIIPYLVAIIVGISMFRASGAIDILAKLFMSTLFFNCSTASLLKEKLIFRSKNNILCSCCLLWCCRNIKNQICPYYRTSC